MNISQIDEVASHEPERGCVVLDQPQRAGYSRVLRLVEDDTAALLWLKPCSARKVIHA